MASKSTPAATAAASKPRRRRGWTLIIRFSDGERLPLAFPNDGAQIKLRVIKLKIQFLKGAEACPLARQRLVYKGRILEEDDRFLTDYGIEDKSTLFLVLSSSNSSCTTSSSSGKKKQKQTTTPAATAWTTTPRSAMVSRYVHESIRSAWHTIVPTVLFVCFSVLQSPTTDTGTLQYNLGREVCSDRTHASFLLFLPLEIDPASTNRNPLGDDNSNSTCHG